MGLFQKKQVASQPDMRSAKRHPVDCPASLMLLGRECEGRLSDLSETGARFDTPTPPAKGVSGLLSWRGHEFFGKVAWSNEDSCGIVFERPLPQAILQDSINRLEKSTGPAANFGNIPIAPRGRRGLVAS